MNTAKKMTTPEPFVMHRRIGSTIYRVGIHFNADSVTLDDKIKRLLKNELQSTLENATMDSLQAGWLSERGSL